MMAGAASSATLETIWVIICFFAILSTSMPQATLSHFIDRNHQVLPLLAGHLAQLEEAFFEIILAGHY